MNETLKTIKFFIDEKNKNINSISKNKINLSIQPKTSFNSDLPWADRFRPLIFDDLIGHNKNILALKYLINYLTSNSSNSSNFGNLFPHLIFYGPPGTGKTSTIMTIINNIYGKIKNIDDVLELNASDDRGINIVRKKISIFVKKKINHVIIHNSNPNNILGLRFIILDEADSLTYDAQCAIKKYIELSDSRTKFCFICNYINNIIEPILKRCLVMYFPLIKQNIIFEKISSLMKLNNININNESLIMNKIYHKSHGDMRKFILLLQNYNINSLSLTSELSDDHLKSLLFEYYILSIFSSSDFNIIRNICNLIISKSIKLTDFIDSLIDFFLSFIYSKHFNFIHLNPNLLSLIPPPHPHFFNDLLFSKICKYIFILENSLINNCSDIIHFSCFSYNLFLLFHPPL